MKQQGMSEKEAVEAVSEMKNRPEFASDKPGKPATKPKPQAKPSHLTSKEG